MKIRSESVISHPLDRVYRAYRDELTQLVPYIPDVRAIRELSREERDGGVVLHNEWISSASLPPVINKVIRPEHLCWDDFADWDDAKHLVGWRIKTRVFTDSVTCGGTNRFEAASETSTRLILDGDLTIDIRSVPGMPGFMARRIGPRLESFLVGMITPNLQKVTTYLQKYLDEQERKA